MGDEAIKRRVSQLRKRMREHGLDAMIVTQPQNVTWLSGFLGHDSWLVVGRSVALITDSRYTEQARVECSGCRIVERRGPISQAAGDLLNRSKAVGLVGIEKSNTLATVEAIRKALDAKVKPVAGLVEAIREVKDDHEIRQIRKSAATGWTALARALAHVRAGITESELAGQIELQIRRLGCTVSFETIVAFGPNGSRNHHQPGSRKLRKNDTILVDFGVRRQGYCSDTTRCFGFGRVTAEFRRAYDTVRQAQRAAIAEVRDGANLADVDRAARRVIEESGLPVYGHGTGHGLGLAVHEAPMLAATAKGKLAAGQVITIEPGIYLPGKFGIRYEDDVLVAHDGAKLLSEDRELGFSRDELPILHAE